MNALFFKNVVFGFAIIGVFFLPILSSAQVAEQARDGYSVVVPCKGGKPIPGATGGGSSEKQCDFRDLLAQIDHLVSLLLYVAVLLSVISFVYAGFKLIFSGGNEDALKHAKHIFVNVLIGLVLAYGAWIIVHFITTTLGVNPNYTLLK
jgi:hypothetical protein